MRFIDKIIVYSTIFALFTEDFNIQYIIQWKLFYLIIIVNFILLLLENKMVLHKNMVFIYAFFALHGLILYVYFSNPITSLLSQLLGISLFSIYFYGFVKNYGTSLVFKVYLKFAFILAFLAIPMFYFQINVFEPSRLNGIMSEPAHYAAIMLPALYLFLKEKKYFKCAIVLITILLAQSSLGYLGILLILAIPLIKIKYALKYIFAVGVIFVLAVNYIQSNWNNPDKHSIESKITVRIKETYESFDTIKTGKFNVSTNLSSYAVISNLFLASQNVLEHPLGTGLGSYRHQYDYYFNRMTPPPYLTKYGFDKTNREDASSLMIRLFSDLGVFSIPFFVLFFIIAFKVILGTNIIRQSTFYYLLLKAIREGHYFPPEFYFFLMIFLKDFDEHTTHS
jgi:hypothetical protein